MIPLIFFSLSIIFIRFIKVHKSSKITHFILSLTPSLLLILSLCYWIADSFTANGIDESIFFHLQTGLGGAGFYEYRGLIILTIATLIFSLLLIVITYKYLLSQTSIKIFSAKVAPLLLLLFIAHPTITDTFTYIIGNHTTQYINQKNVSNFKDYYVNVRRISKLAPKKNIIFIYLEAVERTYIDEKVFPGLMPNLQKIVANNLSFTNIAQVTGTGWTIAGMISSQCGIPLVSYSDLNADAGAQDFLSGAHCLGDILKESGYQNIYLGGANKYFAGKNAFYTSHGFDRSKVYGKEEIQKKYNNELAMNGWGLYDQDLYNITYDMYDSATAKSKQPLLLTMVTLDTHHPNGQLNPNCTKKYKDGSQQLLNIYHCADGYLYDFIKKIAQHNQAKNTIIVLASDHLSMNNSVHSILEQQKNRSNLLTIIDFSYPSNKQINKLGSTLDTGATLLDYLAYSDEGIGLGRSLLSTQENLFSENDSLVSANNQLYLWHKSILDLWSFPDINDGVKINNNIITIKNKKYVAPLNIHYNHKLETLAIKFMPENELLRERKLFFYQALKNNQYNMLSIIHCDVIDDILLNSDTSMRLSPQKKCVISVQQNNKEVTVGVQPLAEGEPQYITLNSPVNLQNAITLPIHKYQKNIDMIINNYTADMNHIAVYDKLPATLQFTSASFGSQRGTEAITTKKEGTYEINQQISRGISLIGINPTLEPDLIKTFDLCDDSELLLKAQLSHYLLRFSGQYKYLALVVHDTAFCSMQHFELFTKNISLPLLRSINFRKPYIALIESATGTVIFEKSSTENFLNYTIEFNNTLSTRFTSYYRRKKNPFFFDDPEIKKYTTKHVQLSRKKLINLMNHDPPLK